MLCYTFLALQPSKVVIQVTQATRHGNCNQQLLKTLLYCKEIPNKANVLTHSAPNTLLLQ